MNTQAIQIASAIYDSARKVIDRNEAVCINRMKIWSNKGKYLICREKESQAAPNDVYDSLVDALIATMERANDIKYSFLEKLTYKIYNMRKKYERKHRNNDKTVEVTADDLIEAMKYKKMQLAKLELLRAHP